MTHESKQDHAQGHTWKRRLHRDWRLWVVVALMWRWIFNPRYGLLNYLLAQIGITGPAWLFDPGSALYAIIIASVWKDTGFVAVMYLAGLQGKRRRRERLDHHPFAGEKAQIAAVFGGRAV